MSIIKESALQESMMPKVSICIPCYNNPEDVQRLLSSIEAQTFQDYEIILSDDSTDDRIEQIAEKHGFSVLQKDESSNTNHSAGLNLAHHQDIHSLDNGEISEKSVSNEVYDELSRRLYVHNSQPLGPIFNWNAAIRRASGEYIKIMFSDDWFTSNDSLSAFVKLLDDNPAAGLAFSGSRQTHLSDDSDRLKHDEVRKDYDRCASDTFIEDLEKDFRLVFQTNQIGAPSATIYRRKREELPTLFDEESGFASDVFLYMRIFSENPVFAWTKEPLVCIGLHEHQYTETFAGADEGIYKDYRLLFQKYQLWQDPDYASFFLRQYLIPYHKGYEEAKALHIPRRLYDQEKLAEMGRTIRSFLQARTR